MQPDDGAVELREIGSALRHGGRWIAGGALLGTLLALAVILWAPRRYRGEATILLKGSTANTASQLGSGSSDDNENPLGSLVSVLSLGSGFDTELEILGSRSVLSAVSDSLGLQAQIVEPRGVPVGALFSRVEVAHGARERMLHLNRDGDGYRLAGAPGTRLVAGERARLGDVALTLRGGAPLPPELRIHVEDLDATVERLRDEIRIDRAAGDVAEVAYRAPDPVTAAAVPNAIMAQYLRRRRTVDRGVNQHQYEFLQQHTDSIAAALAAAEVRLRAYQEQSGILDPELSGQTSLNRAASLQAELEGLEVERQGLEALFARGNVSARDLAAYPTLLRNGAINGILSRLLELESQRITLLQRRTEEDPEVVGLSRNIAQLEQQLVSLTRAYLDGIARQQAQLRQELTRYGATLDALPRQSEQSARLQREVRRLSQTLVALQTQLVQTRLAAVAEGGEVRPIDRASPPRKPSFPRPALTLGLGLFGGLFFGVVGAIGSGQLRRPIRDPREAELATGIPAVLLDPARPLAFRGLAGASSVLLLPIHPDVSAGGVGEQLAATVALQGRSVVLADLNRGGAPHPPAARIGEAAAERRETGVGATAVLPSPAPDDGYAVFRPADGGAAVSGLRLRQSIAELEGRFDVVVVVLPGLDHPATVSLLAAERPVVAVVSLGGVTRAELRDRISSLERMGAGPGGIVLVPPRRAGARAA